MKQLFTVRSDDCGNWRHFKSGRKAMTFLDEVVENGNRATMSSEWVEDDDDRLDTGANG